MAMKAMMRWDDIECQPAESLWKIVDSGWWLKWVTKLDLNGYRGAKRDQGEEKEVGGWPGGWGVFKIAKLFWSANAIVTYFIGSTFSAHQPRRRVFLAVCMSVGLSDWGTEYLEIPGSRLRITGAVWHGEDEHWQMVSSYNYIWAVLFSIELRRTGYCVCHVLHPGRFFIMGTRAEVLCKLAGSLVMGC